MFRDKNGLIESASTLASRMKGKGDKCGRRGKRRGHRPERSHEKFAQRFRESADTAEFECVNRGTENGIGVGTDRHDASER
jgi:hypothetical protein